jgi:hypothetical protein
MAMATTSLAYYPRGAGHLFKTHPQLSNYSHFTNRHETSDVCIGYTKPNEPVLVLVFCLRYKHQCDILASQPRSVILLVVSNNESIPKPQTTSRRSLCTPQHSPCKTDILDSRLPVLPIPFPLLPMRDTAIDERQPLLGRVLVDPADILCFLPPVKRVREWQG